MLSGRGLAASLGLTPSEDSPGATRRLGAITKTGNGHLLIEATWQQRRPTGKSTRGGPARRVTLDPAEATAPDAQTVMRIAKPAYVNLDRAS